MGTIIKKVIIVVLKLLPLNLYYLIHIIDAFRYDGILNIIATAMFTGTFFMPLAGWGLIAFDLSEVLFPFESVYSWEHWGLHEDSVLSHGLSIHVLFHIHTL